MKEIELKSIYSKLLRIYGIKESDDGIDSLFMEILICLCIINDKKEEEIAKESNSFSLPLMKSIKYTILSFFKDNEANNFVKVQSKIERLIGCKYCPENTSLLLVSYLKEESYVVNNAVLLKHTLLFKFVKDLGILVYNCLLEMVSSFYEDKDLKEFFLKSQPTSYFQLNSCLKPLFIDTFTLPSNAYTVSITLRLSLNEMLTENFIFKLLTTSNEAKAAGIKLQLKTTETITRSICFDMNIITLVIYTKSDNDKEWSKTEIDVTDFVNFDTFFNLVLVHRKHERDVFGYLKRVGLDILQTESAAFSNVKVFINGQQVKNFTDYSPGRKREIIEFPVHFPRIKLPLCFNSINKGEAASFLFYDKAFSVSEVEDLGKCLNLSSRFGTVIPSLKNSRFSPSDERYFPWKNAYTEKAVDILSFVDSHYFEEHFLSWINEKKNLNLLNKEAQLAFHKRLSQYTAIEKVYYFKRMTSETSNFLSSETIKEYEIVLENVHHLNKHIIIEVCPDELKNTFALSPVTNFVYETCGITRNDTETKLFQNRLAYKTTDMNIKVKTTSKDQTIKVVSKLTPSKIDFVVDNNYEWFFRCLTHFVGQKDLKEIHFLEALPSSVISLSNSTEESLFHQNNKTKTLVSGLDNLESLIGFLSFDFIVFNKINITRLGVILSKIESKYKTVLFVSKLFQLMPIIKPKDGFEGNTVTVLILRWLLFNVDIWHNCSQNTLIKWTEEVIKLCKEQPLLLRTVIGVYGFLRVLEKRHTKAVNLQIVRAVTLMLTSKGNLLEETIPFSKYEVTSLMSFIHLNPTNGSTQYIFQVFYALCLTVLFQKNIHFERVDQDELIISQGHTLIFKGHKFFLLENVTFSLQNGLNFKAIIAELGDINWLLGLLGRYTELTSKRPSIEKQSKGGILTPDLYHGKSEIRKAVLQFLLTFIKISKHNFVLTDGYYSTKCNENEYIRFELVEENRNQETMLPKQIGILLRTLFPYSLPKHLRIQQNIRLNRIGSSKVDVELTKLEHEFEKMKFVNQEILLEVCLQFLGIPSSFISTAVLFSDCSVDELLNNCIAQVKKLTKMKVLSIEAFQVVILPIFSRMLHITLSSKDDSLFKCTKICFALVLAVFTELPSLCKLILDSAQWQRNVFVLLLFTVYQDTNNQVDCGVLGTKIVSMLLKRKCMEFNLDEKLFQNELRYFSVLTFEYLKMFEGPKLKEEIVLFGKERNALSANQQKFIIEERTDSLTKAVMTKLCSEVIKLKGTFEKDAINNKYKVCAAVFSFTSVFLQPSFKILPVDYSFEVSVVPEELLTSNAITDLLLKWDESGKFVIELECLTFSETNASDIKKVPASNGLRIVFYEIVSGKSRKGADPSSWSISGLDDKGEWHILDKQERIMFQKRQEKKKFWLKSTGFFLNYKIVFQRQADKGKFWDSKSSSSKLNLGQIQFFQCFGSTWIMDAQKAIKIEKCITKTEENYFLYCISIIQSSFGDVFSDEPNEKYISYIFSVYLFLIRLISSVPESATKLLQTCCDTLKFFVNSIALLWSDPNLIALEVSPFETYDSLLKVILKHISTVLRKCDQTPFVKETLKSMPTEVEAAGNILDFYMKLLAVEKLQFLWYDGRKKFKVTEEDNVSLVTAYGVAKKKKAASLPKQIKRKIVDLAERSFHVKFHLDSTRNILKTQVLAEHRKEQEQDEAFFYTNIFGMVQPLCLHFVDDFPEYSFRRLSLMKTQISPTSVFSNPQLLQQRAPGNRAYIGCAISSPTKVPVRLTINDVVAPFFKKENLKRIKSKESLNTESIMEGQSSNIIGLNHEVVDYENEYSESINSDDIELDSVSSTRSAESEQHLIPSYTKRIRMSLSTWINRPISRLRQEWGPWPCAHRINDASLNKELGVGVSLNVTSGKNIENEKVILGVKCERVTPTVTIPGRLVITTKALYFDPDPASEELANFLKTKDLETLFKMEEESYSKQFTEDERKVDYTRNRTCILYSSIRRILNRRVKLLEGAFEIYYSSVNDSLFGTSSWVVDFSCFKAKNGSPKSGFTTRNLVLESLWAYLDENTRVCSQAPSSTLPGARRVELIDLWQPICKAWQAGALSNFEYLMHLNAISGRSELLLSQFPVFPWVITNYVTEELNLQDPENYRDLSKPMGALNLDRLVDFEEKYATFDDDFIPKFLYGSHYSTAAGVVLYFLMRVEPFTSLHVKLQAGHFDYPDRLFNSISKTFEMCTTSLSEVKEILPHFYYFPNFLRNESKHDLGIRQLGSLSNDVELPPYAKTPEEFVSIMRQALESQIVSENLHKWVDLIFGFKQSGEEAVKAKNVFYYLTYPGAVDISRIDEEEIMKATLIQADNFGMCPEQIFITQSPKRKAVALYTSALANKELILFKPDPSLTSKNHIFTCSVFGCGLVMLKQVESIENLKIIMRVCYSKITCLKLLTRYLVVANESHLIKVFEIFDSNLVAVNPSFILRGHNSTVCSIETTKDEQYLISKSTTKVLVHELIHGELIESLKPTKQVVKYFTQFRSIR